MTTDSVLQVGDEIPDLVLEDERGAQVRLRERATESTLILFFYPKDEGLRCRTQACALRESWPLLRSEGVEVFGVNPASAASHQRFRERFGLPFPLLVDSDLALARAFGFARPWAGTGLYPVERSTVIVDPGGTVRVILRNVKPSSHFDVLRVNLGLPERSIPAS